MKILMYGDSITDMCRERNDALVTGYGAGYVFYVVGDLARKNPEKYTVLNHGIAGNRSVDLYARLGCDVWFDKPDVLSILIGVNDVWHEEWHNEVEIDRYEKIYRMMIEDTKKKLPNIKIMLLEPFVLKGTATTELFNDRFVKVYEYAKVVKKLAKEYNLTFVPLQKELEKATEHVDVSYYLTDGVHPNVAGARLIADEWMKAFNKEIDI